MSLIAGIGALLGVVATAAPCPTESWPLFDRYAEQFISPEGRVIDRTDGGHTTSEGQSYALFFALVANDRARFESVLRWTQKNLARGDLGDHLPAWKWGADAQGRARILDKNSASDADLWIAWSLIEAGRLWKRPAYTRLGQRMVAKIVSLETASLPGLGPVLLPAPVGFEVAKRAAWRLNPSYLPVPLFRRFEALKLRGPWGGILASTGRILVESSPLGFTPDWIIYRKDQGFSSDPITGPIGSYDAIRVYLWAAMTSPSDPLAPVLERSTRGLLGRYRETRELLDRVDVTTGAPQGAPAPPGFFAVLRLLARNEPELAGSLDGALNTLEMDGLYGSPPRYYDQNLALFALGFMEGRFAFGTDGRLAPQWGALCAAR